MYWGTFAARHRARSTHAHAMVRRNGHHGERDRACRRAARPAGAAQTRPSLAPNVYDQPLAAPTPSSVAYRLGRVGRLDERLCTGALRRNTWQCAVRVRAPMSLQARPLRCAGLAWCGACTIVMKARRLLDGLSHHDA